MKGLLTKKGNKGLTMILAISMIISMLPGFVLPVQAADPVAKIGNTEYTTIEDAFNAAAANDSQANQVNDTITMLQNCSYAEPIQESNDYACYTLDLNGFTLSNSKYDGYRVFTATKNVDITLKNGKIEGKLSGVASIKQDYSVKLTIENVDMKGEWSGLQFEPKGNLSVTNSSATGITGIAIKGGNAVLDNVTVNSTGGGSDITQNPTAPDNNGFKDTGDALYLEGNYDWDTVITVKGGTYKSANGQAVRILFPKEGFTKKIEINGGTFSSDVSEYVVEGYTCVKKDDNFAVLSNIDKIYDNPTGTKIEAVGDTIFDPSTVLVVKPSVPTETEKLSVSGIASKNEFVSLFDISLMVGDKKVQPNGNVQVTLTLTDEQIKNYKDFKIVYVDENGKSTIIESTINGNQITFETNHFSGYGIIGTKIAKGTNPQTGDNTPLTPLMILAVLSSGIAAITVKKRKTYKAK